MAKLCVNVDHVATVREARRTNEPDPVHAAVICELAGCHGITIHLREDRRHIKERDLRLLREVVKTKLNLEMAIAPEVIAVACEVKPEQATLVPEKREEITTEGGLDVVGGGKAIKKVVDRLKENGISCSFFIDPDERQIAASREAGAEFVELHTGRYANARNEEEIEVELDNLKRSAERALSLGLRVHAGHGLNYRNVRPVSRIGGVEDLNIGHSIISRAVLVGLDQAVREMLGLIS